MTTTGKSKREKIKTDVLGRIRVATEDREAMLDAFESSGMSGSAFAKQHGVHQQTFASWIQKRRRKRGDYDNESTRRKLRMRKNNRTPQKPPQSSGLELIEVKVTDIRKRLKNPLLKGGRIRRKYDYDACFNFDFLRSLSV